MAYLAAAAAFAFATTVIWFSAVALYNLLTGGPYLHQHHNFTTATTGALLLVTLIGFLPLIAGYLTSLVVWWVLVKLFLELSYPRAVLLFLLLAALSLVSRLAFRGALEF